MNFFFYMTMIPEILPKAYMHQAIGNYNCLLFVLMVCFRMLEYSRSNNVKIVLYMFYFVTLELVNVNARVFAIWQLRCIAPQCKILLHVTSTAD